MFFEILKRDLKRKKTMNFIIFIFVIMSVTFVCSSVTNLSGTFNSLDKYFADAGVGDFIALERAQGAEKSAEEIARELPYVNEIKSEEVLYNVEGIKVKSGEIIKVAEIVMISSFDRRINKFYYSDKNLEITEIPKGGVYLRKSALETLNSDVGDTLTVTIDGIEKEFKILGVLKDAFFGGSLMDTPRFLISEEDFSEFLKGENIDQYLGSIDYFYTDNTDDLRKELSECTNIAFMDTKGTMKITYLMEMVVAGMLMIVSICLIIIALFILKFTISFTISEEFREIGIMKAIGIPSAGIRMLYIVKYLALALLGAVIGFICSFPFSNLLMEKTKETIVISDEGSMMLSVVSAIVVVVVVMFFGFRSTRLIKKYTPVDAIRNGSTGERYKKKGLLKLSKSGSRPAPFMAFNDILSGLKRFMVMIITFSIGILLVMIVLNCISTLKSEKLVRWFGVTEADVYLSSTKNITDYHNENGKELLQDELENIRILLQENGMPAKVGAEVLFNYALKKGDRKANSMAFLGVNTDTNDYDNYVEGSAPQNPKEIALHYMLLENLNAAIGDTVTVTDPDGPRDYIVSGTFETMTNRGEGVRFHQDDDRNYLYMNGIWGIQIKFSDNPSDKEKTARIEKMKELLPDYEIYTPSGFTDKTIHSAAYLDDTRWLVLLVVILINILVAVLMEKSFLTKERGEIACLKALGFRDSSIVFWQTLRVFIVMLISTVIAIALNNPVCQISVGGIFKGMGAKKIIFDPNVLESYVIYPGIIIAATLFGVFLTAISVKHISANEINSIE
jgi:putative ABC transport system permease protein